MQQSQRAQKALKGAKRKHTTNNIMGESVNDELRTFMELTTKTLIERNDCHAKYELII